MNNLHSIRTKYLQSIIEQNDKVARFLASVASQSEKSALVYGTGLAHFGKFLQNLGDIKSRKYPKKNYSLNEIVEVLSRPEAQKSYDRAQKQANSTISVYDLLEDFLYYLIRTKKLAPRSLQLYLNAVRSYFSYNDIDIVPSKFKRRVKIPKILRYDEEAIDASDIRNILNSCSNKRLKAYLLVLASGGMRAMESIAIRFKDIEMSQGSAKNESFNTLSRPVAQNSSKQGDLVRNITRVHIRPEYSKTRVGRDIYISDEATKYLKEWIDYRFRDRKRKNIPIYTKKDDDLVFQQVNSKIVAMKYIYGTLNRDFKELLTVLKMDKRKENMLRHKITFISFRRFVKTVLSTQVNQDYSEWFLGHAKSSYWQMKPQEKAEIYSKVMPYLTFLDYSVLEATGKNIEERVKHQEKEIEELRELAHDRASFIRDLEEELNTFEKELATMKKRQKLKRK